MSVARVTEIIASSKESFEAAVREGIARATKTIRNVRGAWIQDQKIVLMDDQIVEYRVTMKVTFVIDE